MNKNKLSRRDFLALATGALAGAALSACQNGTPTEAPAEEEPGEPAEGGEMTEVELWTGFGQGRMADAMAGAVERFNDEYEQFNVNHEIIPWGDIRDKVISSTAAGDPPDVYRGWAWIIGDDAPIGGLTDLTPFVEALPDGGSLDEFWPATLEQMKYQGQIYGMSISTMVQMLYYNKDRMREEGLDPDNIPTDLEGWEEAGEQLYDVADDGSIDKVGFCPLIPYQAIHSWGATRGAEVWDDATQTCIANDDTNGPIFIELLNWYKGYAEEYGAEELQAFMTSYQGNNFGRNTPEGIYYTGLLGIWHIATWLYNDMKEYGPDVDFGVTKVPSPAGVDGKPGYLQANVYLVPTGCENPEGGFNFANFMSSSPWVAINKAGPDSVTPSREPNAQLPELEEAAPWLPMARDEILPFAWPNPSMPSVNFYLGQLNDMVTEVVWNDVDPEVALNNAVEASQLEVDQKLEQG